MSDETPEALIARLRAVDVRLTLEAGKLRVNAPKGALTDELKATIGARREELVAALESVSAAGKERPVTGAMERFPRDMPLPVSSVQQRLWFLDRMAPGTSGARPRSCPTHRGPE